MVCLFGKKGEEVQSDGLGIGRVQRGYREDSKLKRGDLRIKYELDIILRFSTLHTIVQPPIHHK